MGGSLPPIFIEFMGSATGLKATAAGVKTELAAVETTGAGSMAKLGAVSKAALLGIGVAAAVAAVKTVHMAADFQTQMTRIRTSAGESEANMKMVSAGVLSIASSVGESTTDLTSGLYKIESAGFHGADGLDVLKASAEGAKVGNADMATVADATTTALNAYGLSGKNVTQVMNALIGAESEGKANMEDLASSMSGILPVAASAHVGLTEVLGAMSTMTAQGTQARVAATYLRQTIGMLSNPSAKAANEMKNLGLNATDVATELGSKGLAATLNTLTGAIEQHMGPAGTVLINKMKDAAGNTSAFQKILANLPPTQQTYIGALATMVGGTKSMMGALELTGKHAADFDKNVKGIATHVKDGGTAIEGWSAVQKTFNQRMSELKGSIQAVGIEIGTVLLPYALKFVDFLSTSFGFLVKHRSAMIALGVAIGGILVIGLAAATVAVWNFTAALLADPLTWVVIGIIALIAGLVLLGMHWRQVVSFLEAGWHAVVDGLSAAWHAIASTTVSVWDNDIVGPIKSAWNTIANFFVSAYHTVADPLISAWRTVANATTTAWNGITAFFRKWWPLLFVIFFPAIAAVVALWNHFHSQIIGAAKATWNAILAFFGAIWDAIKTVAHVAWVGIELAIVSPVRTMYNTVKSVVNTLRGWLSAAWSAISGAASSGGNRIRSALSGPFNAVASYIHGKISSIATYIKNGLNTAYNDVKGIGSKFQAVGRAIIEGMKQGVESLAGSLASSVKNAANGALKGAKSFLGINSPSRVFRDQVGQWIPAGIAEGINANAHLATAAITGLSGGMVSAAGTPDFGPSSLSGGSAGSGTHIHYHNSYNIAGSVLSESELQKTVQKTMLQQGARNSASYQPFKR